MKKKKKKVIEYSVEDLQKVYKYIYLTDTEMHCTKADLPLQDDDIVDTFTKTEQYLNPKNYWFDAKELIF